jgi:hypothetical protein
MLKSAVAIGFLSAISISSGYCALRDGDGGMEGGCAIPLTAIRGGQYGGGGGGGGGVPCINEVLNKCNAQLLTSPCYATKCKFLGYNINDDEEYYDASNWQCGLTNDTLFNNTGTWFTVQGNTSGVGQKNATPATTIYCFNQTQCAIQVGGCDLGGVDRIWYCRNTGPTNTNVGAQQQQRITGGPCQ